MNKEMIKLWSELTKYISKYNLSDEQMNEIIKANNNDVRQAINFLKEIDKILNK